MLVTFRPKNTPLEAVALIASDRLTCAVSAAVSFVTRMLATTLMDPGSISRVMSEAVTSPPQATAKLALYSACFSSSNSSCNTEKVASIVITHALTAPGGRNGRNGRKGGGSTGSGGDGGGGDGSGNAGGNGEGAGSNGGGGVGVGGGDAGSGGGGEGNGGGGEGRGGGGEGGGGVGEGGGKGGGGDGGADGGS